MCVCVCGGGGFLKCDRGFILCIAIRHDLVLYDATEKKILLLNHIRVKSG